MPSFLCQAGEICCPPKQQLFYLSQRPYLVTGTLRDQLLYPVPPARVWASSSHADQVHYTDIAGEAPQYSGLDSGRCGACSLLVGGGLVLQSRAATAVCMP